MKSITILNEDTGNSFSLDDKEIGICEGFEYPSVNSIIEDISGKQSAIFVNSKFGRRPLSINGFIKPQTYAERIAMLGVLRHQGEMMLLKFTTLNDLDLQAEVVVNKVLYPYNMVKKPFLIDMIAPDWRFYSQTLHSQNIEEGETIEVNNAGTENTNPIFKIYGPFDEVEITNLSTSESFNYSYTVETGDYIEVDIKNKTVKLNGTTSVFNNFTGEFFDLISGGNTIRFEIISAYEFGAILNVAWRDAYLGI